MTPTRITAIPVLGLRIAYGIGLIAAPERLGSRWLGPSVRSGSMHVTLRGIGAREVAVHGAALGAAVSGAPLLTWLVVSIAGDVGDTVATVLARDELPEGSAKATLLVAGGSALITAALAVATARRGDRPRHD
jgi:hypothetical protein